MGSRTTPVPPLVGETRYLVHGVSWATYEALLHDFRERGPRMTYDRGGLEFMTALYPHERFCHLIGRLIDTFTLETNSPIHGGGSTTLRKAAVQRGLEPDESYWIQSEPLMRGKKDFDLE